jgi:hypothetical protein
MPFDTFYDFFFFGLFNSAMIENSLIQSSLVSLNGEYFKEKINFNLSQMEVVGCLVLLEFAQNAKNRIQDIIESFT